MRKVVILLSLFFTTEGFAKSTIESIGDFTQVIVPAYAFGMAINEDGWTGAKQFVTQFAASQITVEGLKLAIPEERPDHSDKRSFPSGHSACAFSGAAFIHKRYGIKRAIIPYLAAGFTGFSRVHAKRHHIHDVLAGATIGGLSGYFLTTRYNDKSQANIELLPDGAKLNFYTKF